MILIEFNGKTACLAEHCRDIGISVGTVRYRHTMTGETWQECLEHYLKFGKKEMIKLVDFNGKLASIREHCKDLGINTGSLYVWCKRNNKEIKDGLEHYQIYGTFRDNNKKHKTNDNHISLAERCRILGICRGTITSMMSKQNLTFEQAVEKYLFIRENEKYDIDLKSARKSLNNRWRAMKKRCYNPKDKDYYRYGERGIRVCDRWLIFNNFFSDMYDSFIDHVKEFGLRNTTLDRVDHDGNYEPSNCDWKTIKEQNNNRCINLMVTEDLNVTQFAEKYGLNPNIVASRVKKGWTVEEILGTSIKEYSENSD